MKNLILFILILYSSASSAAFSAFISITPKNQEEHGFLVEVEPVKNNKDMYKVTFPAKYGKIVHGWLIVCEKLLTSEKQNFRSYIWGEDAEEKNILMKIPLSSNGDTIQYKDNQDIKTAQLLITKEFINRSYIYIDFPTPVFDGGFYYSIDLGSYISE